jgi:hypothetical protein
MDLEGSLISWGKPPTGWRRSWHGAARDGHDDKLQAFCGKDYKLHIGIRFASIGDDGGHETSIPGGILPSSDRLVHSGIFSKALDTSCRGDRDQAIIHTLSMVLLVINEGENPY